MNNFFDQMNTVLTNSDNNVSVTENGALGYRTTGKKLLDMNFAVSSLRNVSETEIERRFAEVCGEDLDTAIVWLFFARDVREGMGERRLFRVCMNYLAREWPDKVRKVLPLIAEYGRWDDLLLLFEHPCLTEDVVKIVSRQLKQDLSNMRDGFPVSLLAKWCWSENTSSPVTRNRAARFREAIGASPKTYRKLLSALRKYIDVTERKMSANEWGRIDYEKVSSQANLKYNKAFMRHDEDRRSNYLASLEKGEAKINSSVLFPHDIVHQYGVNNPNCPVRVDPALEGMWKSLRNTVQDGNGTIVVADGSGSMTSTIGQTNIRALDVANSLAIYFAERLPEPFRDQYITFSSRPQLVDLRGATSLIAKICMALRHNEVANTNIEAVFDLILATAVNNHLLQEQLPKNVLVISD